MHQFFSYLGKEFVVFEMLAMVWCTCKDWHAQSLKWKFRSWSVKLIHLALFREVLMGHAFIQ